MLQALDGWGAITPRPSPLILHCIAAFAPTTCREASSLPLSWLCVVFRVPLGGLSGRGTTLEKTQRSADFVRRSLEARHNAASAMRLANPQLRRTRSRRWVPAQRNQGGGRSPGKFAEQGSPSAGASPERLLRHPARQQISTNRRCGKLTPLPRTRYIRREAHASVRLMKRSFISLR